MPAVDNYPESVDNPVESSMFLVCCVNSCLKYTRIQAHKREQDTVNNSAAQQAKAPRQSDNIKATRVLARLTAGSRHKYGHVTVTPKYGAVAVTFHDSAFGGFSAEYSTELSVKALADKASSDMLDSAVAQQTEPIAEPLSINKWSLDTWAPEAAEQEQAPLAEWEQALMAPSQEQQEQAREQEQADLLSLAYSLDQARMDANAIECIAAQGSAYGQIATALQTVLAQLFGKLGSKRIYEIAIDSGESLTRCIEIFEDDQAETVAYLAGQATEDMRDDRQAMLQAQFEDEQAELERVQLGLPDGGFTTATAPIDEEEEQAIYRLELSTVDYYVGTIHSGSVQDLMPTLQSTLNDYGLYLDAAAVMQTLLDGQQISGGQIEYLALHEDY